MDGILFSYSGFISLLSTRSSSGASGRIAFILCPIMWRSTRSPTTSLKASRTCAGTFWGKYLIANGIDINRERERERRCCCSSCLWVCTTRLNPGGAFCCAALFSLSLPIHYRSMFWHIHQGRRVLVPGRNRSDGVATGPHCRSDARGAAIFQREDGPNLHDSSGNLAGHTRYGCSIKCVVKPLYGLSLRLKAGCSQSGRD